MIKLLLRYLGMLLMTYVFGISLIIVLVILFVNPDNIGSRLPVAPFIVSSIISGTILVWRTIKWKEINQDV